MGAALYKGTSGLIKKGSQPDAENRIVEGYYTNDKIDLHGHIIDREAMVKALPEYMEWGTVREMHEHPIGTLVSIGVPEWNYLQTRVAKTTRGDQVLLNVQEGVYKAFSVGIIVTNGYFLPVEELEDDAFSQLSTEMEEAVRDYEYVFKITGLVLIENSIVDRPANPAARVKMLANEGMDVGGVLPSIDKAHGIDAIKDVLPRDQFFVSNGTYTHTVNAMGLSVPDRLNDPKKQASEETKTSMEENDMDKELEQDVATEEVSEKEVETTEVIEETPETPEDVEDIVVESDAATEEESTEIETEDKDLTEVPYTEYFDKVIAGQEATSEIIKSLGEKIDNLIDALSPKADEEVTEDESVEGEVAEEKEEKEVGVDIEKLADVVVEKIRAIELKERKGAVNNQGIADTEVKEKTAEEKIIELKTNELRRKMATVAVSRASR